MLVMAIRSFLCPEVGMKNDKAILDRLFDFLAFISGILVVGCVLTESFEVFMRYFANRPQVWTIEISEYSLFLMTMLGAPWLLKQDGHIAVDILTHHLKGKKLRYAGLFSDILGGIVSGIVSFFAILTAIDSFKSGVMEVKLLAVPKHYFLALIVFAYLLLCLEFLRRSLYSIKELKGQR